MRNFNDDYALIKLLPFFSTEITRNKRYSLPPSISRSSFKEMMLHKITPHLCRLCGKENQQGTDLFQDKIKGSVLISIINKYFAKEVNMVNY
jgi:hypothetical protein